MIWYCSIWLLVCIWARKPINRIKIKLNEYFVSSDNWNNSIIFFLLFTFVMLKVYQVDDLQCPVVSSIEYASHSYRELRSREKNTSRNSESILGRFNFFVSVGRERKEEKEKKRTVNTYSYCIYDLIHHRHHHHHHSDDSEYKPNRENKRKEIRIVWKATFL